MSLWCLLVVPMQLVSKLFTYEKEFLRFLTASSTNSEHVIASFDALPSGCHVEEVVTRGVSSNILMQYYSGLQNKLSYISLGQFPTPVHECKKLHAQFPRVNLFVKHDGLTGKTIAGKKTFGGNKLRKLQYLLADAIARGHRSVITFGCIGSNHALQTTVCAKGLGLDSLCILQPQPNSLVVRRNLLLQEAYGAQLYFSFDRVLSAFMTTALCYDHKQREGKFPYVIPVGGSNARGAIGYVEAAFELQQQIDSGLLPTPDRLYVTLGSGGTAAGLLLGIKAAGIKTKLYLVINTPENIPGEIIKKTKKLLAETNALLQSYDSSFPTCHLSENDYEVITDCTGEAYGLFTSEGVAAMNLISSAENINLDGTYTGKCFAALVRDLQSGACDGQTVLFWNTFCGEDFGDITESVDYHRLPLALHRYFEEEVQQ